ncbi:translocon-associated protein subunit alpha [Ciona intestinalis]
MFRNLSKFSLLFLLVFPTVMLVEKQGLASAEDAAEDEVMNEDEGEAVEEDEDESVVEEEGETEDPNIAATEEETEDEAEPITAHREAETAIIFNSGVEPEIIAGKKASGLIHFSNTGSNNFIITSIDGSFRYPQDFSYVIQNFSVIAPNKMIDAGKEGSFQYDFLPGELAGGRSFGLLINVNYKDTEENIYKDAVYNQTIQVLENEEGVDAETFFMYIMLMALGFLGLFGLYHLVGSKGRKTKKRSAPSVTATSPNGNVVETGTNGPVDYKWIPEETLKAMNKGSPSPGRSPRKRHTKKASAAE